MATRNKTQEAIEIIKRNLLTLEEMKNIMRKMLAEEKEWHCDMLVERIYEAQKLKIINSFQEDEK